MELTAERRHAYPEGKVAKTIEKTTARMIPSDAFLWAGGACILASLILKLQKKDSESIFVGHWVPTLLLLGIYNKMVKLHGTDD